MIPMNQDRIANMLDNTLIGRLAMAHPDGRPYAIPLPFCFVNGSLYLRVPMTGRKGDILLVNNQVCFEIDSYTDQLDDYASILIEGRLVAVTDLDEKALVRAANDAKYNRLRHLHRPGHGRRTALADLPTRKLIPNIISGRTMDPALRGGIAPVAGGGASGTDLDTDQ